MASSLVIHMIHQAHSSFLGLEPSAVNPYEQLHL